jgi:hypothetical protein
MFSEIRATKAEAVAITAAGNVRIYIHLDHAPSGYFQDWFRNPSGSFASTERFNPRLCSFPTRFEKETEDNVICFEIPEDVAVAAVEMVKEWIPIANEYANKKNATAEKRRRTLEMHQKAREEEQRKQLEEVNRRLERLNRILSGHVDKH